MQVYPFLSEKVYPIVPVIRIPYYSQKAINECEGEYTDNKKLIELRDIRKQIPKGFSFFAIGSLKFRSGTGKLSFYTLLNSRNGVSEGFIELEKGTGMVLNIFF